MRLYFAVLILTATVSACGSGSARQRDETPSSARPSAVAARRIEHCVDRLLERTTTSAADKEAARRYVRDTYCARFDKKGWVYDDGALRIAAQTWLEKGTRCTTGGEGKPTTVASCEAERRRGLRILDCALLHVVRRDEVSHYIDRLRTNGPVTCDDGTPLDELGIP